LKKEIKRPEDKFKEIRAVTAHEVKMLANQIFKNNKLNLATIGPIKNKSKFKKILSL
jgi:predicted Zn-dependent peptidase